MTNSKGFPERDEEFLRLQDDMQRELDIAARLPSWPFRAPTGFATIYEYDQVLGGTFGSVLDALADTYGDEACGIVGLEPTVDYYRVAYGHYPGLWLRRDSLRDGYGIGMRHEPGGDPTGALAFTINVIGMFGTSGAWSIWAQRDWEIGLLLTRDSLGPWLDQPVPWFPRDVDLDTIRSPSGWGMPLTEEDRSTLWRNLRERGSGK